MSARVLLTSTEAPEIIFKDQEEAAIPDEAQALLAQLEEGNGLYNGRIYRILAWQPRPFSLTVGETTYFKHLAVRGLLQAGRGSVMRPDGQPDPAWSHYVGVDVLPVTADGLCLVARRSEAVGAYRGRLIFAAAETAEVSQDPPDATAWVRRALWAELGVWKVGGARGWALAVNEDLGTWAVTAVVDVPEISSEVLRRAERAPDAWERVELMALNPDQLALLAPKEEWAPIPGALLEWATVTARSEGPIGRGARGDDGDGRGVEAAHRASQPANEA